MTNVILSHCCHCSAQIIFLTSLSASFPSSPSKHQIQAVCFQFYNPSQTDFMIPIIPHKVEKKWAINFLLLDFQISPTVLSPVLSVMIVRYLIIVLHVSHSDFSSLRIESLGTYIACYHDRYFLSVCHCHLVLHGTIILLCVCAMPTVWSWSATWEPSCSCSNSHATAAATASKSFIASVIYHVHWSASF